MSRFALPHPGLAGDEPRRNDQALLDAVNDIGRFVFAGTGVPTFTPDGPAIFFRLDGTAGTSVYIYQPGTGWKAL